MAWFETWFNTPYYHILYKDRNFEEAEQFISLLIDDLQLHAGATIIDLACGKGRHSVYLNKLGFKVLGLDLSEESIRQNKVFENTTLTFKVHDMRHPIYPEVSAKKADAVLNLFTSFGYFDSEEEDRKIFRSVEGTLVPGGLFVLDFLNEKWVKNTLVPEETITKQDIDFHITKKIENQFVIKDIRFTDKGIAHHYFEKVKLHPLETIKNYAAACGFESVKTYGDYTLQDFDAEKSPRCINVFRKILK
ncbi:SAM-dependent methyltransferase [Chryseobacterium sp. 6424]|uniref:class I SAM-dependent methyltransferase n=1 Tax=Chryseobacterium sp. 6424 TaxID=2039166 RepID=UPI000EFB74D2|nr:class I SAM-dependent methyltransferase [Chryseobacterium sp. 6424]AYO57391.1 SAM-dependent methyltransferase [Chryseobacterium sp. 6424]